MYIASNGIKTAVIMRDTDPDSPRDPNYHDNLGNMVCWHSRYRLGDDHNFKNPQEFIEDMTSKYISDHDFFKAIHDGKFEAIRTQPDKDGYRIEVFNIYGQSDDDWHPDYYEPYTISKDFELTDGTATQPAREDLMSYCSPHELIQLCSNSNEITLLPLYLYDHSGISISTGSFIGRAPHAEWDSGQVGFIYMDKATALEELVVARVPSQDQKSEKLVLDEENWKTGAKAYLVSEVQEYDNYLCGDIYGYKLYEGLEEIDACWGYNPGSEDICKVMKSELGDWLTDDMAFDFYYDDDFDIESYYDEHEFPAYKEKITKQVATQLYEDLQIQVPFPYGMSFNEIRSNTDGVLDAIVTGIYETHAEPTAALIKDTIFECAGVSRSIQPKLTVSDLDPSRDYTADELMDILHKKPSLADLIANAEAKANSHGPAGRDPELEH